MSWNLNTRQDVHDRRDIQQPSVRADGMNKDTVKKHTFCEFLINFMQSNQNENGSARDEQRNI